MIKKLILTVSLLLGLSLAASAQVASGSLFPGDFSPNPAAAGWRMHHTISYGYSNTIFNREDTSDDTEINGGQTSGNAIAAFKMGPVAVEGSLQSTKMKMTGKMTGWDFEQDGKYDTTSINLALMLSDSLVLGAGYVQEKGDENIEIPDFSYDQTTKRNTTELRFGATVRMLDFLFLGGSVRNVTDTGTEEDSGTEKDLAKNTWSDLVLGIGMVFGDPKSTMLRLEYYTISSPKSETDIADADPDEADNDHASSYKNVGTAELIYNSFLISYSIETEEQKNNAIDPEEEDEKETTTSYLIGWIPREGFMVAAGKSNSKTEEGTTDGESDGYTVTVGFNF